MKYEYSMIKESQKDAIFEDAINCMISALEYRDLYTKGHSHRVGEMAALCGKHLDLKPIERFYIEIAGQLHDIGKIGVPDNILLKNGKLSDVEWREMKRHPAISADIISEASLLGDIAEIVYQHHERWDGKGYPDGLSGEEIKLGGRVLALCDAIDAMASNRAYRESLTWEIIKEELHKNMGSQFDPSLEFLIPDLIECWMSNFEKKYDNIVQSNMNIENLVEQHKRIRLLIEDVEACINSGQSHDNLKLLAYKINKLAGVLRIHLSSEDRYLYPLLMDSEDINTRELAESYDKSMGGLSNAYISFKTRYNTYMKIADDYNECISELNFIFEQLITRLDREDNELYPLVK